jgi:hypothetical protein
MDEISSSLSVKFSIGSLAILKLYRYGDVEVWRHVSVEAHFNEGESRKTNGLFSTSEIYSPCVALQEYHVKLAKFHTIHDAMVVGSTKFTGCAKCAMIVVMKMLGGLKTTKIE